MIDTATDLIDALGGTKTVADLFGVQDNTVSTWRVRGFPGWACSRLREAAETAALRYDCSLFEIRARGRVAPSTSPTTTEPERTEDAAA